MKKLYKVIACCLSVLVTSCNSEQSITPSNGGSIAPASEAAVKPEKISFKFSEQEINVLKNVLNDELTVFSSGGDSIIDKGDKYIFATSSEIQNEYERNEVAGDKKYKDKALFTSGIVKSIDRSVGENYFISLNGGSNPFISPKAKMADGYTDYLAALNKKDKISLVCTGGGMLMGSAILLNCHPVEEWVKNATNELVTKISSDFNKAEKHEKQILFYSIILAKKIPKDSSCFADVSKSCNKDLKKASKLIKKEDFQELIAKYGKDNMKDVLAN